MGFNYPSLIISMCQQKGRKQTFKRRQRVSFYRTDGVVVDKKRENNAVLWLHRKVFLYSRQNRWKCVTESKAKGKSESAINSLLLQHTNGVFSLVWCFSNILALGPSFRMTICLNLLEVKSLSWKSWHGRKCHHQWENF